MLKNAIQYLLKTEYIFCYPFRFVL